MNIPLIFIAGIVAAFVLMQLVLRYKAVQMRGRAVPGAARVDGMLPPELPRVYYFHAPNCGPCRSAMPVIERLRAKYPNLIKIDVTQDRELAREFGIAATPSFVAVRGGLIRKVVVGGLTERRIVELFDAA